MAQNFNAAPCAPAAGNVLPLLVLLPGRFGQPQDFIREGFLQAVREKGFALDVLIVDAHLGYYRDRSILERLRADVFEPARKRGVTQIWVAGISIGAFGALLYADAHPGEMAGLIAIGPYLGSAETSAAIRAANGLQQWQAPEVLPPLAVTSSDTDAELHVWRWLQAQTRVPQPRDYQPGDYQPLYLPPLYLGFGRDDRYRDAHQLLADVLPPQRVVVVDGGHDWDAWRPAWRELLERLPVERRNECKRGSSGE
jgi:pimeloyl-ACP methyl ester carboxylesterase